MAYKTVECETTVGAAISDAFSAFEELGTEMRETYDNMEGANMGHLPKCEAAGTAADELENHVNEPDVPEFLQSLPVKYHEQRNKSKRRSPSRSVRLSNAQGMLQAARDIVQHFVDSVEDDFEGLDEKDKTDEARAKMEEQKDEAESFIRDELDDHCEFDVEFPGMFG